MISLTSALAAWAVVPFSDFLVIADVNAGLLYVLAMTSLGVYGVIIAGWASNSKYALLGAMRSAAQIVAYEIAMGFALVVVLMAAGSLNLREIVLAQEGGWLDWVLAAAAADVRRLRDLRNRRDQPGAVRRRRRRVGDRGRVPRRVLGNVVLGVLMAEYANMVLISALAVIMFLGGWLSPLPGLQELAFVGWFFAPGVHWFVGKLVFFMFLYLWLRATFPRYRYDQIMRLGWKVFIPPDDRLDRGGGDRDHGRPATLVRHGMRST